MLLDKWNGSIAKIDDRSKVVGGAQRIETSMESGFVATVAPSELQGSPGSSLFVACLCLEFLVVN